jgi:MoxR-like ATPase
MEEIGRVGRRRRRQETKEANPIVAPEEAGVVDGGIVGELPVVTRLNNAAKQLNGFFAEREAAVRCMMIALLTGMNYLLVGPRGTAKTVLSKAMMKHVDGSKHFSTLLGSFSTLNDLIGRIDLAALQRGEEKRKIEGKLLDCDTAFIDEALKGSDGVLNSLLGLLSDERDFDGVRAPLWSVGSATNWPEVNRRTDRIAALYDRFHIKVPVTAVKTRAGRVQVLRASRVVGTYTPTEDSIVTLDELRDAALEVANIQIDASIEDLLCSIQERCIKDEIDISDRKLGQWQRGIQANAWLSGRTEVSVEDMDILPFMAWDNEKDIAKATAIISSCDLELAQGLIKRVDEARQAYANIKRTGLTAANASQVLEKIIRTAESVSGDMKRFKLRESSRNDVARAVKSLQRDFEELYSKFQPALDWEG